MTSLSFGANVLTDFPFTDLTASKRRPALVISRENERRTDVVVAYITSVSRDDPDAMPIAPSAMNGLKTASMVRFDKIATIDKAILSGRLGDAEPDWLEKGREKFFGVFGFGAATLP